MPIARARGGKDEFYNIVKSIEPSVKRLAFADELKLICDEILLSALKLMETHGLFLPSEFSERILTDKAAKRAFLIDFGTKIMRKRLPDIWRDVMVSVNLSTLNDSNFIISDCRFMNEFKILLNNYKVVPVLIDVDKDILFERYCRTSSDKSIESFNKIYNSETEQLHDELIDSSDSSIQHIDNNGTIEQYREQIVDLLFSEKG